MAGKRITTELVIKAVDQYSGMIRNMSGVTGQFATKVRSEMGRLQGLRGPLRLIEDFRTQQQVVRRSGDALAVAREKTRRLLATIRATENPTAAMRREFDRARASADRLADKHDRNRRALSGLQGQMKTAGVNTADLAGEQQRLTGALGAANAAFARQAERMDRLRIMQDRITAGRERMDRSLANAANLSLVGNAAMQTGRRMLSGMSAPIMQAVEFESAMSDVRKVVDFESPAAFRQMSDDILEMSTRIPMAATALATITAAGGQAGIPQAELIRFAEMAAKIGVAFDISADQAGTFMAQTKTAMRLSLDETGAIFDAMNHLSNNSAARADQTMQFLNRAGADGVNFGFDANETLAYGAAMIAAGAGADTAATSFRNMGRALVRGDSATDRQSAAMTRLGLNSADVAKAMQEDAVGTSQDVIRRLNELPAHLRATTMSDLFGDEARELTKLMNNMQLMPEMLALVADETSYLGSAQREYNERSQTTANNMQLMRNQTTRLGISIGTVVLPALNDLLAKSQKFIDKLVIWTKEHPKLTKWLVISGVALGGMAVAGGVMLTAASGLIGMFAVLRFGLVGLSSGFAFALGGIGRLGLGLAGLSRLPRLRLSSLITPLRWVAGLIPPIGWAALAGRLRLASLVKPVAWVARLIPPIGWAALAGRLRLASLVKPVAWVGRLIPSIGWAALAGGLRWSSLIKPLLWFGRGALRFIPVIGWAALAGELLWTLLVKPLGWDEFLSLDALRGYLETVKSLFTWGNFLSVIKWAGFLPLAPLNLVLRSIFDFKWSDFLPDWSWDFIPEIDLSEWITWPEAPAWMSGTGALPVGSSGRRDARQALREQAQIQTPIGPAREVIPLAGARALGGPMQAGLPYLAGERGPEPIFSSKSAFVATNRQMQGLQARSQSIRAAGLAALSSVVVVTGGAVAAQPVVSTATVSGGGGVSVTISGDINIAVPAGVTDPHKIAEITADLLGQRIEGVFASSFSD